MRRFLTAAAVLSCVCAFLGCRHIAGVCDCCGGPNSVCAGCLGSGTPLGGGTPIVTPTPPPPMSQPEPLKRMPQPADAPK